ncbi:lipoyl synthase [Peredibacter sp. HCB2-198]|uniref:lipoyl synthase n=1 Tax=Peredibacter sp. HCB2-198 TaxID=3383025 RepID=UPI0038B61E2B
MAVTYFDKDTYQRKPEWLKVKLPQGDDFKDIRNNLREKGLSTVCEEAKCPNISECWSARTATVMILGDTCTRACKFCHVKTGNPKGFINHEEIENTSKMVGMMSLRYVVITSVDRDDVADHGSGHFAAVVNRVHQDHPETKVEVLIPDFAGDEERMHTLAKSNPFVIAQNLETVKRLTHPVRDPRAGYEKTLNCLKFYKTNYPHIQTKTSLMVGLGETWAEIQEALEDIRAHGVDIVTFGQYLQPSKRHLDVKKFYTPEEFEELKRMALKMGFKFVASGPLVRSSYKASDFLDYVEAKA